MITPLDLEPAARTLADLVGNVPDDRLDGPTPCPLYTLGDLLDHVNGLSVAFAAAAAKDIPEGASQGPSGDASRLGDDWRRRASGQRYDVDAASIKASCRFVEQFSGPDQEAARAGLFGPVVEVSAGALLLDRVIGMSGRDPGWRPAG